MGRAIQASVVDRGVSLPRDPFRESPDGSVWSVGLCGVTVKLEEAGQASMDLVGVACT